QDAAVDQGEFQLAKVLALLLDGLSQQEFCGECRFREPDTLQFFDLRLETHDSILHLDHVAHGAKPNRRISCPWSVLNSAIRSTITMYEEVPGRARTVCRSR